MGRHKKLAENLFSLPICVMMELAKSLPPSVFFENRKVALVA